MTHYSKALDAIQFLDELGGPDAAEYVDVMRKLSAECERRAQRCEATHLQGVTRPGFEASAVEIAYTVHGFNLIGTGGNCTAFYKALPGKRHILITAEDAQAPTSPHESVDVGLYRDGEGESLDTFTEARGIGYVIAGINARNWK